MNEIKIRRATLNDINVISIIKVNGWQSAYKNIISDEYLYNMSIQKTIEKNTKNFNKYSFIVAIYSCRSGFGSRWFLQLQFWKY